MNKQQNFKIEDFQIKIIGGTALLQNRNDLIFDEDYSGGKTRGEDGLTYENRIWKKKAHYDNKGNVIAPQTWFKRALINSQRQSNYPIKPAGARKATDTMRPYFISGVMFDDSIIHDLNDKPITAEGLVQYKAICKVPATGGNIPVIRPMIPKWKLTIRGNILDKAINIDMLRECFQWIGIYSGIGDYRPQNGGMFGTFRLS